MGAWIEIEELTIDRIDNDVAPFVGAWIEIDSKLLQSILAESLPSWERGLKSD